MYKIKIILLLLSILILSGCAFIDDIIKVKPIRHKSEFGLAGFEAKAEQKICANKACVTASYQIKSQSLVNYVIVGSPNIQSYLRENDITTSDIDVGIKFLDVLTDKNGGIRNLKFIIPTNETKSQDTNLCNRIKNPNIECQVQIMVPSEDKTLKEWLDAGCFLAFGNIVPDPADAICVIVILFG